MPIYAYRCSSCGHAQDVLQKLSDPLLTDCPNCGAATFVKQVTAAGFQLKGSGWYVTDFRDGNKGATKKEGEAKEGEAKPVDAAQGDAKVEGSGSADAAPVAPAVPAPAKPADAAAAPAAPAPPPASAA
jgi:putative FmdB family regulatory protein